MFPITSITTITLSTTTIASSTCTRINAIGTKSGLPYSLLHSSQWFNSGPKVVTALTGERVAL